MNPSDVAQRLRLLVDASGLSQNALSELAGLDRTYLRLVVTGARTAFGAAPMAALAQLFGADLDWLLLGRGDGPTPAAVRAAVEIARAARDHQPPPVGASHTASDFTVDRSADFDQSVGAYRTRGT